MVRMYLFISLLLLVLGSYQLFFGSSGLMAIHSLLVSLYFYMSFFEVRGRPFSRKLYFLLVFLLLVDGTVNLMLYRAQLLSSVVSFLFAYFAWRSLKRLAK